MNADGTAVVVQFEPFDGDVETLASDLITDSVEDLADRGLSPTPSEPESEAMIQVDEQPTAAAHQAAQPLNPKAPEPKNPDHRPSPYVMPDIDRYVSLLREALDEVSEANGRASSTA